MSNICWFQLLKCDSEMKSLWILGWTKTFKDITFGSGKLSGALYHNL